MDETFLTTEEVLEYLQVNLRTVYRLIKAGKIPAVRVGRQWRFRKRDIDAWLDSQRPRGGSRQAAPAPAAAARPASGPHAQPRARRRRRGQHSRSAAQDAVAQRRVRRGRRARRPIGARAHAAVPVRSAHRRSQDAGHGRPDGDPRSAALQGRPAGDHHHGLLHRVERHRRRQPRRVGLPHQALPRSTGARRRRQGPGIENTQPVRSSWSG